jgi:uncharacterized membrane protein YfcA
MEYVVIGVVGFFVSIGSAIAGGGGGLVMTPLMILIGLPPHAVLTSQKAAGIGINLGAMSRFAKEKSIIDWKLAGLFSALAVLASIIGTQIVFVFNAEVLERLVGIATLILIPLVFINRKVGLKDTVTSQKKKIKGVALYFVITTFQAGLGAGTGAMLMFVFMGLFGLDALKANAMRRVSGLVLVTTSFTIFIFSGYIDWVLAAVMGVSMFAGGYIGAHIAVKKGSALIMKALLVVAFIAGVSVLVRSFV